MMKKGGFTLAEILVTLGIIAVLAAITMPLLGSITPDKKKVMVIKYQKVLSDLASEIATNLSYSWIPSDTQLYCVGFGCYDEPPVLLGDSYTGVNKFRDILWTKLDGEKEADENYFNTTDGVRIKYTSKNPTLKMNIGGIASSSEIYSHQFLDSIITIDVDGENEGNNCVYSSSCKKPDQFKFWINTYGKVEANDPLTAAYIKNSSKLNDRKKDVATASKDDYNYDYYANSTLEYK
jgi:prepilin-type N-terminal cleavage/methylation domain-containing protein